MANMIRAAVGDSTEWNIVTNPQPVATKLLALHSGIVKVLPDFKAIETANDVKIEHHLHIGDKITPYRTNLDGCGYVIAVRDTVEASLELAAKIRTIIDETIVRE